MFDALLFDFDGVLADSEPFHYKSWSQVLEPFGIHMDFDYYLKNCVGIADRVLVSRLLPSGNFQELVTRKQAIFRKELEEHSPFLPQTIELIQELSKIHRMAVVSSSFRTEVEPPLERAGLRPYFELVITAEDVMNLKPNPEPYQKAAARLGAKHPLVIEDSATGLASGLAAGFDLVRVTSPQSMADQVRARLAE